MKTVIVTIAIALALVIPASAQWQRTEKTNLITGKTDVTYTLASEPPEKAIMMVTGCGTGGDGNEIFLGISTGFQVSNPNPVKPWFTTPVRVDSWVSAVDLIVIGDLSESVVFSRDWTRRLLIGEVAKGSETPAPKEVIIEVPQFAAGAHQLVFKAAKPLPVVLGKGKKVFCPEEPPQTAASATSK
jgi:hypothetical protein